MRRLIVGLGLALTLVGPAGAQEKPQPPKVAVYVFTAKDPSGFVTQEEQWRDYTVQMLTERLTKDSKTVRTVTTRETAMVLVEITRLSRREEANSPVAALTQKVAYRYATITAREGAYTTEISERTKDYYAKGLAQALEAWVKLNAEKLAEQD